MRGRNGKLEHISNRRERDVVNVEQSFVRKPGRLASPPRSDLDIKFEPTLHVAPLLGQNYGTERRSPAAGELQPGNDRPVGPD